MTPPAKTPMFLISEEEVFTRDQMQQVLDVVRAEAEYNDGDFYFKVNVDAITNLVHSLEPVKARRAEDAAQNFTLTQREQEYLTELILDNKEAFPDCGAFSKDERDALYQKIFRYDPDDSGINDIIKVLKKIKNTFNADGFLCVDHDLPVLYVAEAQTAIDRGIQELQAEHPQPNPPDDKDPVCFYRRHGICEKSFPPKFPVAQNQSSERDAVLDGDTVTMPRWVFKWLTEPPKPNDYKDHSVYEFEYEKMMARVRSSGNRQKGGERE